MSLPSFDTNGNWPAGIHSCTWEEARSTLAFNSRRETLFALLQRACEILKQAGCDKIYIGGSFATNKKTPGDFDVCWKDDNVDFELLEKLDPVFLDIKDDCAAQKAKYGGEMFPASTPTSIDGRTHLEFFQQDRDGNPKGIVEISL